ncbi:hypothetical protein ACRASX_14830 [Flavobacterium sp. TMP13]|uniref:hypothetical protein n=1 Tax=Flavobacterium sp. TMP13 TaxID=3425950 RepID=UPI003D771E49
MWTKENSNPDTIKEKSSLHYFIGNFLHSIFKWMQEKWAVKMNQLTSGLSKKYLIGYWFLFVAAFAGILSIQIRNRFHYNAENTLSGLGIPNLHLPVKAIVKSIKPQSNYTTEELKRILKFSTYLDSIKNYSEQVTLYDSIKIHRPGLLDSLLIIENKYQLNLKKQEYGNKTTVD